MWEKVALKKYSNKLAKDTKKSLRIFYYLKKIKNEEKWREEWRREEKRFNAENSSIAFCAATIFFIFRVLFLTWRRNA